MKKSKLGCWSFVAFQFLFSLPVSAVPTKSTYNWNGFYLGATAGGVLSRFSTNTSTQAGPLLDLAQANTVNKVGNQVIDTTDFLSGIEGGYNWQLNRLLIGFESDIQSLSTNGETNSGAVPYPNQPGNQLVITSYGNNNWLFTARPRIGLIANNWLFYATGGLGLTLLQSDFLFSNNLGQFESKRVSTVKSGYVIGVGGETILTNHISVKAEYLFADFNNTTASTMNHNIPAGQTFSNSAGLKNYILRMGLNYHVDDQATGGLINLQLIPELFNANLWETEIGTRLFISTGIDGAPQPLLYNAGMPLISRLTFSNLNAISQDVFARADHVSGLFAKGYLGAGSITNGQLNDEDFPAGGAYSNTLSNAKGNLSYATLDFGYSFLNKPTGKTGAFIGYNYFAQNINVYSCMQQANAEICHIPSEISDFMGISEDDYFHSLRIGLSTQMNLTKQLTLTSESAYLPIVTFSGKDMHNARQLMGPEQSTHGDGAMLESVLDYQLNNSWSLGLGGRYWMWNMRNGSVTFDFLGSGGGSISEPARYNTERYGVFLQLNYRDKKSNNAERWDTPFNWKGLFVGGHMGGAWGKSYWSDPFGPTSATGNLINSAGFGDKIRSTGPLGGANLNINWQTETLVYGVGGSISAADIRGENTLFSGLGGVNGQTVTNYLGTIVGRLGVASNRSLFYVNGGRAMLNTTYKINANTDVLTLGSESETINTWGWMGGVGVEYALTDHWISNVEYDYIHIPHYTISLPSIATINTQRIAANQNMNVFKVGFNYKFDVFA